HDMRNILASAQLMSDRLSTVKDPTAQSLAPKLVRALDRAVAYSEGVLAYGRTQEAPPARRRLRLRLLVEEVRSLLGIDLTSGVEFVNMVDPDFEIDADSEQLFRVLTNLCRNALQAMAADREKTVVSRLSVSAERIGGVSRIFVADTGPGLPQKARENLFAAFRGSARSGGTGLGLAIAHELVRAHGGSIDLVESVGGRTVFSVTIPDQPVRLAEARGSLRRPA
nr:HAMP domain-containing histidine kinase [Pseudaminobacter sp.]